MRKGERAEREPALIEAAERGIKEKRMNGAKKSPRSGRNFVTIQVKIKSTKLPRSGVWREGRVWRANRSICEGLDKARRAAGFAIQGPEAGKLGIKGWPITA